VHMMFVCAELTTDMVYSVSQLQCQRRPIVLLGFSIAGRIAAKVRPVFTLHFY